MSGCVQQVAVHEHCSKTVWDRFVLAYTPGVLRVFCSDGFPYVIAPAFSTPAFSAPPFDGLGTEALALREKRYIETRKPICIPSIMTDFRYLLFSPVYLSASIKKLEMGKNPHCSGSVRFWFYKHQGSVRFYNVNFLALKNCIHHRRKRLVCFVK